MKNNRFFHLFVAIIVVLFLPYALFGKNKKVSGWIALLNGMQLSLTAVFLEMLFLAPNPFLAIFAVSPMWKRFTHATK